MHPYNVVRITGFTSFTDLPFWKLHLGLSEYFTAGLNKTQQKKICRHCQSLCSTLTCKKKMLLFELSYPVGKRQESDKRSKGCHHIHDHCDKGHQHFSGLHTQQSLLQRVWIWNVLKNNQELLWRMWEKQKTAALHQNRFIQVTRDLQHCSIASWFCTLSPEKKLNDKC